MLINHCFCIVLYKCKLSESETYLSLIGNGNLSKLVKVYIYTNSPDLIDVNPVGINFSIKQNKENKFLAENYLDCIAEAKKEGLVWVTFFDQDTVVSTNFLILLAKHIQQNKEAVAFYPQIDCDGTRVSPYLLKNGFPSQKLSKGSYKANDFMAINSCSTYCLDTLLISSSIDKKFPLDYLDYAISKNISNLAQTVIVMDVHVEHSLSIKDGRKVPETRAESILKSEARYFKCYRSNLERIHYLVKRLARVLKALIDPTYHFTVKQIIKYSLNG